MSEDKMTIERFVKKLAECDPSKIECADGALLLEKVQAIYRDGNGKNQQKVGKTGKPIITNIYAGSEGKIRRENLYFYLKEMYEEIPTRLLVGEAPGQWGCFRTGIPFTDINTLDENDFFKERRKMNDASLYIASFEGKKFRKEQSSTVVWKCMNKLFKSQEFNSGKVPPPLLWNIYPFYPGIENDRGEITNRTPEDIECDAGVEFLEYLLDCFPSIKHIHAVGRKSEGALERKLYYYIRHPANGGASEFKRQFSGLYGIEYEDSEE